MKKSRLFVCLILLLIGANCFADEYTYPDVPDEYIGTYVPVQLDIQFRRTKNFYSALYTGYPDHHDVLFIGKNKCYSDVHFHDGYAIKAKDFKNFRFIENENGKFVMDQNGNGYKQITNYLNENGYGYEDYESYVINILFDLAKDMKNISIEKNKVIIDGKKYSTNLDRNFLDITNVAIWLLSEEREFYALIRNGENAKLCGSKRGEYHSLYPDETNVITEIPLFF